MSDNLIDCSTIEQRIDGQNLYISTTEDQLHKLDPHDPDIQNKRDALTRKLDNLREQLVMLQQALEDCQHGKGMDFPQFEILEEGDAV